MRLRTYFQIVSALVLALLLCNEIDVAGQDTYVQSANKFDAYFALREQLSDELKHLDTGLVSTLNTYIVSGTDTFVTFNPAQRTNALLQIRKFKIVLKDVLAGIDFHYNMFKRTFPVKNQNIIYVPPPRGAIVSASNFGDSSPLYRDKASILTEISQAEDLSSEEKEFLIIYFNSIVIERKHFDVPRLQATYRHFMDTYPGSPYRDYVDNVLNLKMEPSPWSIGAGFYTGVYSPRGDISTIVGNYVPLGGTLEGGYNRWMLKLRASYSFDEHPKQAFDFNGVEWTQDSTIAFWNFSASIGFRIIDHRRVMVTPTIGIAKRGLSLGITQDVRFKPNAELGVDIDWKCILLDPLDNYYVGFNSYTDETYLHLRLHLGYAPINNQEQRFNGSEFFARIEFGIFEHVARHNP